MNWTNIYILIGVFPLLQMKHSSFLFVMFLLSPFSVGHTFISALLLVTSDIQPRVIIPLTFSPSPLILFYTRMRLGNDMNIVYWILFDRKRKNIYTKYTYFYFKVLLFACNSLILRQTLSG